MARLNANNLAETELVEGFDSIDDVMVVDDSSVFPEPPFRVTLEEGESVEIVEVREVDGNELKGLSRGLENTVVEDWGVGVFVEQRLTAEGYESVDLHPDVVKIERFKREFETIRNRKDYIEYILNEDEEKADEITSNEHLNNYIWEAENDKYDRFIDPNIDLGLTGNWTAQNPELTTAYEAGMFLAPPVFLNGLMENEDAADVISQSELLMDGVMEADPILENQFGKPTNA